VPKALNEWQFSLIEVSATPRVQLGRAAGLALRGCEIGGSGLYIQAVCYVEYSSRAGRTDLNVYVNFLGLDLIIIVSF
jgi:hypothetical protein